MTAQSKTPTSDAEVALRERMASIEAKQVFHQETLKEVSKSLHEVVKTQHTLANQSKEISKILDTIGNQQDEISSLRREAEKAHLVAEYLSDKVNLHTEAINQIKNSDIEELKVNVHDNTKFTKTLTKVFTGVVALILIPLVLAYIKSTTGM